MALPPGVPPQADLLTGCPLHVLQLLFSFLPSGDAKALRSCSRSLRLASRGRFHTVRIASLLQVASTFAPEALPGLQNLDYRFSNAASSKQLIALLKAHPSWESGVQGARLSGREGLLAAVDALQLCCPGITKLDVRCQHNYRGRHKECSELSHSLAAIQTGYPELQELHLSRFPLSEAQLAQLCGSLQNLRSLSIRGLKLALHSESIAPLTALTALTELCIDHLELQGDTFPGGAQLRSLVSLCGAAIVVCAHVAHRACAASQQAQQLGMWRRPPNCLPARSCMCMCTCMHVCNCDTTGSRLAAAEAPCNSGPHCHAGVGSGFGE